MQARRDPLTAMKEMGRPSIAIRPPAEQMTTILNYCSILHYLLYFLAAGEP